MSVSLYYTATRIKPITKEEQEACDKIAARYDAEYPFGELYEGFCIYDLEDFRDEYEKDIILNGATKLPMLDDQNDFSNVVNWWLECLGEITDVLTGAEWHVHIDDVDIEWPIEVH